MEQITVGTSSIGISSTTLRPVGNPPMMIFRCRLETAEIRYRTDGAPTSTVGTLMEVGDVLDIDNPSDAARIRFIRTTGVSGVLDVEGFSS
jgi:hypothetical protein